MQSNRQEFAARTACCAWSQDGCDHQQLGIGIAAPSKRGAIGDVAERAVHTGLRCGTTWVEDRKCSDDAGAGFGDGDFVFMNRRGLELRISPNLADSFEVSTTAVQPPCCAWHRRILDVHIASQV